MNFGGSIDKILVLLVIAAFIIGPDRLPRYAEGLGRMVRRAKEWAGDARDRVRDEVGPEFDEVDWRKLDPRQYDPRRIIRDALLDDAPVGSPTVRTQVVAPRGPIDRYRFERDSLPPYDPEST